MDALDATPRAALALLALALLPLAGCTTPAPPAAFPRLGPLDDAATVAVVRSRSLAPASLYAVLEVAYDGPERRGAFDAVVRWRADGALRLTAFKDLLLAAHDLFDLLLAPGGYALASEDEVARGPLARFPAEQPRFAGFYWAGAALFLAGQTAEPPRLVERGRGGVVLEGRLPSGAEVRWTLEPETLAVLSGRLTAPGGAEVLLDYADWRRLGERFVPGEVRYREPARGVTMTLRLTELEWDPDLPAADFDLEQVGAGPG